MAIPADRRHKVRAAGGRSIRTGGNARKRQAGRARGRDSQAGVTHEDVLDTVARVPEIRG